MKPKIKSIKANSWFLLSLAYAIYCLCHIYSSLSDHKVFNYIGFATVFLFCFSVKRFKNNPDFTFISAALLVLLPFLEKIIGLASFNQPIDYIKHAAFFMLFMLLFNARLIPLPKSIYRWVFIGSIAFAILVSLKTGMNVQGRLSGIFAHPNQLILTAFGLLFFINEEGDSKPKKIFIHSIIIISSVLTSTIGGFVGYTSCLLYKFKQYILRPNLRVVSALSMLTLVLFFFFLLFGKNISNSVAFQRIQNQYNSISDHLNDALQDRLDYNYLREAYGSQNTSGLWRIAHWGRILESQKESTMGEWLFGHGLGVCREEMGNFAHNEYLRILYEQGLTGFFLNLVFFISIFRKIPEKYRYTTIVFFVFCISGNIFDNFLYMSLLVFYVSGFNLYCRKYAKKRKPIIPAIRLMKPGNEKGWGS